MSAVRGIVFQNCKFCKPVNLVSQILSWTKNFYDQIKTKSTLWWSTEKKKVHPNSKCWFKATKWFVFKFMRILLLQSFKFTKRSICCLTKTKHGKMIMKGLLSTYARTVFQKTNISNHLIRTRRLPKRFWKYALRC